MSEPVSQKFHRPLARALAFRDSRISIIALGRLEAVAVASDLGMVFLLERHDLVAHHRPDGGDERADFVGDAEIHVFLPRMEARYDAQTALPASGVSR